MPSIEEYASRPREQRLARIALTPEELAAAVLSADVVGFSCCPVLDSWALIEVICYL